MNDNLLRDTNSFRYCPACGEKYLASNAEDRRCNSCGYIFHAASFPSAGAIIWDPSGSILMIKRKQDPGAMKWDIPAGFCTQTESFEEALRRELREEIGLESYNSCTYHTSIVGDYEYRGLVQKVLCAIFTIQLSESFLPVAGSEVLEARFFKPTELVKLDMAFPQTMELLHKLAGINA